jgi:hypothetical protein
VNTNRMLMGAAIIGCLTAAMAPGAYAQQGNVRSNAYSRAHANVQTVTHAAAGERRLSASPTRHGHAELGAMRGDRRTYVRAGINGGYGGDRMGYRDFSYGDRTVESGLGPTGGGYAYQPRRLYAYSPTYAPGYVTEPSYGYALPYDAYANADPYYAPYAPAYSTLYETYAPEVGVGIGPIGIGIGQGWGW